MPCARDSRLSNKHANIFRYAKIVIVINFGWKRVTNSNLVSIVMCYLNCKASEFYLNVCWEPNKFDFRTKFHFLNVSLFIDILIASFTLHSVICVYFIRLNWGLKQLKIANSWTKWDQFKSKCTCEWRDVPGNKRVLRPLFENENRMRTGRRCDDLMLESVLANIHQFNWVCFREGLKI